MAKGYTYDRIRATFSSARFPDKGKPIAKGLRIFKSPTDPLVFLAHPYSQTHKPLVRFSPSEVTVENIESYGSQTYERLRELLPWPLTWPGGAFATHTVLASFWIVPGLALQYDGLPLTPQFTRGSDEPALQIYSALRRYRARLKKYIEVHMREPEKFTHAKPTCAACGDGGAFDSPEETYRIVMQQHVCDRVAFRFASRDGQAGLNSYTNSYLYEQLRAGNAARLMNWYYSSVRRWTPEMLAIHLTRATEV